MARKNVTTKEALDAWKQEKKGTTGPVVNEDEVVIAKSYGTASGNRLKTADDVVKFLGAADQETKDATVAAVTGPDGAERISIPVIITDETVDRDDDVVVASGGDMSEYRRNPVMLFSHDHRIPAIGNGLGVHLDGNAWKGIAQFAAQEDHPFGAMIGRLYEKSIMRAISQGFIPKEWTYEEDRSMWAMKFLRWEMIEFSPCNVGSNRNSLAQARSIGIDVSPALEMASLVLDGADVVAMPKAEAMSIWKMLKGGGEVVDMGRMKSLIEAEHLARVKSDRLLARRKNAVEPADDLSVVDWKALACDLGKAVGSDEFQRLKRANTFGADEAEALAENTKAADPVLASLEAGEVKAPECPVCVAAKTTDEPPAPAPEPAPEPPEPGQGGKSDDGAPKPGDDAGMTEDEFRSIAEAAFTKATANLKSDMGLD